MILALIILAVGIGVFWPGLAGDFIYDDHIDIRNVDPVFTPGGWADLFTTASAQLFRPVKYLSYYIDNLLFGWSPRGWHWQSHLWHAINGVLLFFLARRFGASLAAAAIGAVWFAIHPVHTEAVVWISSRASLQSTTGILLMLLGYHRWLSSRAAADLAMILLGGFVGFFSKEDALMIFPILVAYDWYVRRECPLALFRERSTWQVFAPLGLMALLYLVLRQSILSGVSQGERTGGFAGWLATQPVIIVTYFRQLIWPDPMSIDQPVNYTAGFGLAFWGASILLLLLLAFLISRKESLSRWQFALAFFFITLIPVIGIIPINQARADRFLYLPSVAASFCVAWAFDLAAARPHLRRVGIATVALWCAWFGWRSWDYSKTFLNERVLWEQVLKVNPESYRAWANIAALQNNSGRPEEALRLIDRALKLRPDYPEGWIIKGYALAATGNLDEAESHYRRALQSVPNEARWLLLLADLLQRQNRHTEAEEVYDRITAVRPGYVDARLSAGAHAASQQKFEKAREHWAAALRFDPKNEAARHNLRVLERASESKK